jgi:hypothetical protein
MDETNRFGEPFGLSLIRLGNAIPDGDFDLLGLAGKALRALQEHRDEIIVAMEAMVEVIYAQPYAVVSGDNFDVDDPDAIDNGLAKPILELVMDVAALALDGGPEFRESMIDGLDDELAQSAICTLSGLVNTEDPSIEHVSQEAIPHAAEAWMLATDTSNDHWDYGTGNSLRDLAEYGRSRLDDGAFDSFKPPLTALFSDPRVQEKTKQVVIEAIEARHIEGLAEQMLYLASVDVQGRPLSEPMSGDISALQTAVRLLHEANQPLVCDLLVFEFDLGNLGVTILQELAQMEAGQVEDSLDFMVGMLDGSIAPLVLEAAAENGLCDGFTPGLLADLTVLERLGDPEVGNLVEVIHGLLDAVYEEGRLDRVEEMVQLLAALHSEALIPPVEEVLRDLATSALVEDVFLVLPTIVDADALNADLCPEGSSPLTFDQLWDAVDSALNETSTDNATMENIIDSVLDSDQLWTVIERGALLALEPDAHIHGLPPLILDFVSSDEAQDGSDALVELLDEPDLWNATLTLLESPTITDAVLEPTDEVQGPLPFMTSLIISDTVTLMLQTLDLVLDTLGANENANP